MSNISPSLELPYLLPAQAQKTVTVNEGLGILDAVTQLVLTSTTVTAPPPLNSGGNAYAVPAGASGDWLGHEGEIAVDGGAGWRFVTPRPGWRAWLADQGARAHWDGAAWVVAGDMVTRGALGATTLPVINDILHTITPGADNTTGLIIPNNTVVHAVSGKVTTAFTGALTSFAVGLPGEVAKYSSGLSPVAGSNFVGVGAPQAFYADTPITLTPTGDDFVGGEIRISLHLMTFAPGA